MSNANPQESNVIASLKMTDNINWTPIIQKMTLNGQQSYLTGFLYLPVVNEDELAEYEVLCAQFGVHVDNPIKADLINLYSAKRGADTCKACLKSKAGTCYKSVPTVVDGRIKILRTVCQDDIAYKIIRNADVPLKFRDIRANSWNTTTANTAAVRAAVRSIRSDEGLYIYGSAGTGKTMLCSIIINERAYCNKTALFYTVTDLIEDLKDFNNNLARIEKMKKVQSCPCLVIDDLGAEYVSDWVASTLFTILDARYKKDLMTVINSNFSVEDIATRYSNYHGERIARRIKELCKIVKIA